MMYVVARRVLYKQESDDIGTENMFRFQVFVLAVTTYIPEVRIELKILPWRY